MCGRSVTCRLQNNQSQGGGGIGLVNVRTYGTTGRSQLDIPLKDSRFEKTTRVLFSWKLNNELEKRRQDQVKIVTLSPPLV